MDRDYQINIKQVDNGWLVDITQQFCSVKSDVGSMLQRVKEYVTGMERMLLISGVEEV